MKIIEQTNSKLIVAPRSLNFKIGLGIAIAIILIVMIFSVYLIGFVMPKDSTFSCDRLPDRTLQCQIEESFVISQESKITPLENIASIKSVWTLFEDPPSKYIKIRTNTKILGFISFPNQKFTFPTRRFNLILISNKKTDKIAKQIEKFLHNKNQNNLKIKVSSYITFSVFCIIYFSTLLIILMFFEVALFTRVRYVFDRQEKKIIWSSQIFSFRPTEYEIEMSNIKIKVSNQSQDYEINLYFNQSSLTHFLYRGSDREETEKMLRLIAGFLTQN